MLKGPVPLTSGMEVHPDDALHAAHPEVAFTIDDGTDVSRDVAATFERLLDSTALEIIEIKTGIAAYLQAVVDGVDGKCTYKGCS